MIHNYFDLMTTQPRKDKNIKANIMNNQIFSSLPKIIRLPQVKMMTGCSRTQIYLKISKGNFPAPISLGARSVGWLESDVIQWIEQRITIRTAN